jgi:autotransporter adhesin
MKQRMTVTAIALASASCFLSTITQAQTVCVSGSGLAPAGTAVTSRDTACGGDSYAEGGNSSAFGQYASATGTLSTALGSNAFAVSRSTAIGDWASASDPFTVAIGDLARATSISSVAVGAGASAIGGSSNVAVGVSAVTRGSLAVAVGAMSAANDDGTVAIGSYASALSSGSLAFGWKATSSGTNSVAIGYGSNDGGLSNVVSVGSASQTRRITNVTAGVNATDAVNVSQLQAVANQIYSVVGGVSATYSLNANPSVQRVAVQSVGASMSDPMFAAQGGTTETAIATGTHAVAAGANAIASGSQSTALGAGANASASNAVALGAGSVADRDNAVSVGAAGSERQITNVAPGTQGTDAVNLNQLNGAIANGVAQSQRYTDRGVAAALAIPSVPMLARGEKWVGASVGGYGSAQALGVSAAYQATMNLNVALGVSTAVNSGGSVAWRAQAGYRW